MLVISFSHSNENNTSEFETFLRGILPPSNTDLRILQGSLMEQLVKLLQLLDSEEKEVLVISADAVPTAGTLQLMLTSIDKGTRCLVGRADDNVQSDVAVDENWILSVDSPQRNALIGGMLVVRAQDEEIMDLIREILVEENLSSTSEDGFLLVLRKLSRALKVRVVDGRGFIIRRFRAMEDRQKHIDLHAGQKKERVLLRKAAVKDWDNLWTTIAVSPWSQHFAFWASTRSITPNQITGLSFLLAVLSAGCFAVNGFWMNVFGAVLLQLAFGADCADGQLARLAGKFTQIGSWFDWLSDRIKELIIVGGLTIGASSDPVSWKLGCAVFGIYVLRSQINQSFESHREKLDSKSDVEILSPLGFISFSRRFKNFITFPYGDRMGMISIVVIISGPLVTLEILLIWSSFAMVYQAFGRIIRGAGKENTSTGLLRDDGFTAKKVSTFLPNLPGEFMVLVLGGLVVLILRFDTNAGFIIGVFVGTLIALFPIQRRSVWIGPVITTSIEIFVFLGCISLSNNQYEWILFVTVFCFAMHRLIISTEVKFISPIRKQSNFFSWEERTILTCLLFILWPPVCLIAAVGVSLKAFFSIKDQMRVISSVK